MNACLSLKRCWVTAAETLVSCTLQEQARQIILTLVSPPPLLESCHTEWLWNLPASLNFFLHASQQYMKVLPGCCRGCGGGLRGCCCCCCRRD